MTLSIEAQRWDEAKAIRFLYATLNILRFALVEQLAAYAPSRGQGDDIRAHLNCRYKSGRYTDRADAERARQKIEKKDGSTLQVYGCVYCGHFHLTNSSRKAQR